MEIMMARGAGSSSSRKLHVGPRPGWTVPRAAESRPRPPTAQAGAAERAAGIDTGGTAIVARPVSCHFQVQPEGSRNFATAVVALEEDPIYKR